jgi:hypothetical protein
MNIGTAISMKLSSELKRLMLNRLRERPIMTVYSHDEEIIANGTGMPIANNTRKHARKNAKAMPLLL